MNLNVSNPCLDSEENGQFQRISIVGGVTSSSPPSPSSSPASQHPELLISLSTEGNSSPSESPSTTIITHTTARTSSATTTYQPPSATESSTPSTTAPDTSLYPSTQPEIPSSSDFPKSSPTSLSIILYKSPDGPSHPPPTPPTCKDGNNLQEPLPISLSLRPARVVRAHMSEPPCKDSGAICERNSSYKPLLSIPCNSQSGSKRLAAKERQSLSLAKRDKSECPVSPPTESYASPSLKL